MQKFRWPLLSTLVILLLIMLVASLTLPTAAFSQSPSRTPTRTATGISVPPLSTVAATATPTREVWSLASPTPTATEDLPEAVLTLTAFSRTILGTLVNQPTPTPGPRAIQLSGKPHYVDFYADWCAPCIRMKPTIAKMKKKYGDQITFWDVDVDNFGTANLQMKYQIRAIPTTILLDKDGKLISRFEGYLTEEEVESAIQELLAGQ